MLLAVAPLAAALLMPAGAGADPLDEFGFGARAAGLAGSYVADARGADAAHHNPAGVALGEHPAVLLGYGYGAMQLQLSGRDAEVLDARGTSLGIALPLSLGEVTLGAGLSAYLPDQFLARVQLIPASEPRYILLDNDPHRMVLEPVVAASFGDHVAIGAGVSMLANAQSDEITFDVGVVSGEKVGQAALDAGLPTRVAPLVGILVRPTPRVRIGATYRGELSLDLALDILANVEIAGVVTGDALVSLRASNYFTPRTVHAGIAVDALDALTVSAQAGWADWSAYPGGLADLRVLVALDITPPLVATPLPAPGFEDTVSARAGAEYRFGSARTPLAARIGYGYLPTPVPEQTGLTSFADNDRHLIAAGFGLTLADWAPVLTRPIDLSVALQWHHLARRLTVKDEMAYPGTAFSSTGDILHVGTTLEVAF